MSLNLSIYAIKYVGTYVELFVGNKLIILDCWQVTAAFIANLGTISTGLTMGFSAVAIPQLLDKNATNATTLRLTAEQTSWVGTLLIVSTRDKLYTYSYSRITRRGVLRSAAFRSYSSTKSDHWSRMSRPSRPVQYFLSKNISKNFIPVSSWKITGRKFFFFCRFSAWFSL